MARDRLGAGRARVRRLDDRAPVRPRAAADCGAGRRARGLWLLGSWRILRIGVYVSAYGVRIRGLAASRTLRWTDIESFALDEVIHRFGGFELPRETTVRILCRNGRVVRTPLWAQGIDFHARPGVFREVYHGLRERHLVAQAT